MGCSIQCAAHTQICGTDDRSTVGPCADAWLLLSELRPDLAPTEMPSELRRLPEERAVEPREASLNATEPRESLLAESLLTESLLAAAEPR